MQIEVVEESATSLAEYARIPIAFEVRRVFEVADSVARAGGFELSERDVAVPYMKDYDADGADAPLSWSRQVDKARWPFFVAVSVGRRIGGAVVAFDTPGVDMLEGRSDLGVLWDIRVAPDVRGHGVGVALLRAAETWAKDRGCRQLKVETQSINVPACRFYASQGFVLRAIDRFAYPAHPDEVQLLWYKDLG
jgi:GNAT superfamily N-acetyltransferase